MGRKWEVNGYAIMGSGEFDYLWIPLYMGPSMIKAFWVFFRSRKKFGCVKIEMRK